jgi:hypothetical protein
MRYARWTLALIVALPALALTGCGKQNAEVSKADPALEVRYLEVSPDRTEALVEALNQLLTSSEAGSASVAGPGQILLRTDARTQQQIETSLEGMTAALKSQPQRDPTHRVQVQVWSLRAGEGLESLPPVSAELKQALVGLPYADWRQLEASVQTRTTDGRASNSSGRILSVHATLFRLNDGYLADLSLLSSSRRGSPSDSTSPISTNALVGMRPGEYVLLSFRDENEGGEALVVRLQPIDSEPAQ